MIQSPTIEGQLILQGQNGQHTALTACWNASRSAARCARQASKACLAAQRLAHASSPPTLILPLTGGV